MPIPQPGVPPSPQLVREAARQLAGRFASHIQVRAVVLGGSRAAGSSDGHSDLDLYLYSHPPLDPAIRDRVVTPRASHAEIDNRYWETEDDWIEQHTGLKVEVIHRDPHWLEDHLRDLLERYQAQLGYTTAIWHHVLTAEVLFDHDRWFASLQERVRVPYPDGLVDAIVAHNLPLLVGSIVSYPEQIRLAAARGGRVSVQHRVTALLASYFDVLFAINRTPHPGEKRLLTHALGLQRQPRDLHESVEALLDARDPVRVLDGVDRLVSALEEILPNSRR